MNKRSGKKIIRRNDYARVLVTETLPYETPVIFSNDGLYEQIKNLPQISTTRQNLISSLVFGTGEGDYSKPTIPYIYKIKKDTHEYRRLAIIHPRSQWMIKEFYQKFENLIIYYCTKSPASIRFPYKIASVFYIKSNLQLLHKYKESGKVSVALVDNLTKHSPSYYAYKWHNRLYKFYKSKDYFGLEKNYSFLQTLDVSKCFDSIYTHVMSWAVKDKEYTKKFVKIEATFAQEFDSIMRHANHNETNGIVIGPEISRIFAEIIFQKIDTLVIRQLEIQNNIIFDKDYTLRRYVDDLYIFSNSQENCKNIYLVYSDVLKSFNLNVNSSKSTINTRPFTSEKSRLIHDIDRDITLFVNNLFESIEGENVIIPKFVISPWKVTRNFIESIKTTCSHNQVAYDNVANYIISALERRVKRLVAIENIEKKHGAGGFYKNVIFALLDAFYFLYQTSPSVNSSYKLCSALILLIRFSRKHLITYHESVVQRIYELSDEMLASYLNADPSPVDGFLPLEILNIILGIRELGDDYLLREETLISLFCDKYKFSYFSIISCLFYIRDARCYDNLRKRLLSVISDRLKNLSDIRTNTEKAYLLLDMLSCPYAPPGKKAIWLKRACTALGTIVPSTQESEAYFEEAIEMHTHIDWTDVDLLNTLEKRELNQAY